MILCLNMIVKNEMANPARCLGAVAGTSAEGTPR